MDIIIASIARNWLPPSLLEDVGNNPERYLSDDGGVPGDETILERFLRAVFWEQNTIEFADPDAFEAAVIEAVDQKTLDAARIQLEEAERDRKALRRSAYAYNGVSQREFL